MSQAARKIEPSSEPAVEELEALIIGGGVSGIYQLYCLRNLGLNVRIFEAGGGDRKSVV